MATDKLIGILFIPWILIVVVPFLPFYNKIIDAYDLVFLIGWIQIGLGYLVSYWAVKLLDSATGEPQKTRMVKFGVHTIVQYILITFWFKQLIFESIDGYLIVLLPLLILCIFISELMRIRMISKLLVTVEIQREAKFSDYFLTFLLLGIFCGIWDFHKRLKSIINSNTAPNKPS